MDCHLSNALWYTLIGLVSPELCDSKAIEKNATNFFLDPIYLNIFLHEKFFPRVAIEINDN